MKSCTPSTQENKLRTRKLSRKQATQQREAKGIKREIVKRRTKTLGLQQIYQTNNPTQKRKIKNSKKEKIKTLNST